MSTMNTFQYPVRTVMGIMAVFLSLVAVGALIARAAMFGTARHVVAFSIYGMSLVALWTMSTLFK
jgi:channel protein (hemolysin III family)